MSRIKNHITLLFCIMALWVGCFLYGGVSFPDIIKVLMYNLNLALIGLAVAYAVLPARKTKDNFLLPLSVSFPIGLSVENILFILFSSFHIRFLLAPVFIVSGVVSILVLYKNFRQKGIGGGLDWSLVWGILFIVAAFLFLIFIRYYPIATLPRGGQRVSLYVDLMWHLGNVKEAMRHWPLQDVRMLGQPFYYHYFCYLHLASQAIVMGVSPETLLFRTFIPIHLSFLVLLAFELAKHFYPGNSGKCVFAVLAAFFTGSMSFLQGYWNVFLGTGFGNLFLSPTYLMSLIVFLAFVLAYLKSEGERRGVFHYILLVLLFWTTMGAKGSMGPVILGTFFWLAVVQFLRERKIPRDSLTLFLLLLGAFVYNMYFIFGGFGRTSEGIAFSPLHIVLTSGLFSEVWAKYLRGYPFWQVVLLPFILLIYFLGSFAWRLTGLVYLRNVIVRWKKIEPAKLFLTLMIFFSLMGGFMLKVSGKSELYFLFYGFFLLSLLSAGLCFEYLRAWPLAKRGILAMVILITTTPTFWTYYDGVQLSLSRSYLKYDKRGGLSGFEAELIYQLGKISKPDDAIFTNAYFNDEKKEDPRWFYGSGISGRRFFLEGWKYGPQYYAGFEERKKYVFSLLHGREDIKGLKEKYGVQYILFLNAHEEYGDPMKNNKDVTCVFENSAGRIYQIKNHE